MVKGGNKLERNHNQVEMAPAQRAKEYSLLALCLLYMVYVLVGIGYMIYVLYRLLLPGWLVFPAAFEAFIYFFDTLPLQHYWNPTVRELYPRRQWQIEKIAMNLLRRMRILPAPRRLQYSKKIPIELWSIILDHVIDVPFVFDTACDAKTFNLFISKQEFQTYSFEYKLSERERKKLRLVCVMWAALLDQRKMRWLALPHSWNVSGTSFIRADLEIGPISLHPTTFDARFVSLVESMAMSGTQVASLNTLAFHKYLHVFPGNTHESFRRDFLPHAKELSGIRSLIFGWEHRIPAEFFMDLQQSFSHLTFLHLEGDVAEGTLRLDELDILRLDVLPVEIRSWSFPSLRHIALGNRYLAGHPLDADLIPVATERLLSLLLPNDHTFLQADAEFWRQFSSLEFLGVCLNSFAIAEDPPPHYPLAHLCLAEAYTYETLGKHKININKLRIGHLSATVSRLPLLQLLTMPDQRRVRYPPEWRNLFKVHQARGVKWVDERGRPINALKKLALRTARWWELKAHVAFGCYFIFVMLVHLYHLPNMPSYFLYQMLLAPLYLVPISYTLWRVHDLYTAE